MKKTTLYSLLFIVVLCSGNPLQAQQKAWTLEECIQYAIDNNIELKQIQLEKENREIQLNTSKFSWVPDLSASVSQDFGFGRTLSSDNTYVDRNSAQTGGSLSTNMPLFDGFYIPNDIAAKKLNLLATIESFNKAKEDMAMNVAAKYIDVLYNKELLGVAELQLALSTEQLQNTEALVEAGRASLSQLYEVKAQVAKDEVTVTERYNDIQLSLLDLIQLLELERTEENFTIVTPNTDDVLAEYMGSILPPDDIYDHAVLFKPQIREQQYLLESEEKNLKMAQSEFYPKLNLRAGIGTSYYHYYGDEFTNKSFGDQIKANEQKYIGLSLSIPIFSRFRIRNNVRSARVGILNRQLVMDNTKKTLYKEIQQAYYSATAAQSNLISTEKSVEASQLAFTFAEESYNAGKSTAYEFNEAKTKLAQSLAEQARAKYKFIFQTKILDFYNGVPITL